MRTYSILTEAVNFTRGQKKAKYTVELLCRISDNFGPAVLKQCIRDSRSFPFWDSASMIEQNWSQFETGLEVYRWVNFVFYELGYWPKPPEEANE